jgi:hypothetical protein
MEENDDFRDDSEEVLDDVVEDDSDIPDVWWADDIRRIEDPDIRQKEIEAAEALLEERKELLKKHEDGEIDEATLQGKMLVELDPKERKAATRCGLESVGLDWDQLGDLAEDYDALTTGDTEFSDQKERLKEMIREMGPDDAQELADEMYEDARISKQAHETISRQVRLSRESSK